MKRVPLQLLTLLIRSQCASRKDIIAFNLEGHRIEFGLRDFYLITGLNCNEYPKEDILDDGEERSSTVRKAFFNNSESIDRREIMTAFTLSNMCNDDSLKIKLANLYLLECLLLTKQPHNKISWRHVKMLDDEEKFNSYPWGRACFDLTIEYFKKAIQSKSSNVSLQGFPIVLVFWAFEIIPKLSDSLRGFGKKMEIRRPRFLSWESQEPPHDWQKLNEEIFMADDFEVIPIIPTEEEKELDNYKYFLELSKKEEENKKIEEKYKEIEEEVEKEVEKEEEKEHETTTLKNQIEILKKGQEELKWGQEDLKRGQEELQRGQDALRSLLVTLVERVSPPEVEKDLSQGNEDLELQNKYACELEKELEDEEKIDEEHEQKSKNKNDKIVGKKVVAKKTKKFKPKVDDDGHGRPKRQARPTRKILENAKDGEKDEDENKKKQKDKAPQKRQSPRLKISVPSSEPSSQLGFSPPTFDLKISQNIVNEE